MKKVMTSLAIIVGISAYAQVGINEESPKATLEIKPNTQNVAENATTNEGILIPQLTKKRVANIAASSLTTGTMVYVKNVDYTSVDTDTDKRVESIMSVGFYYYDGTKWVGVTQMQTMTGNIRETNAITVAEWAVPGTFALILKGTSAIQLPPPANYKNKILSVNNQSGGTRAYADPAPENWSSLTAGMGHILMSNGTNWYIIGGSY